ncbi:uncharacterized protein LOC126836440 [Adelges cooleyi]|uniref:uncharacterized protein LOC126836440 n=1 Tax=Adelges cooleyi TaxID=133065 RepID=UPI00217F5286|nr:uncharacterized protein LOC126836440 [Adelges cooleyi]XP_050425797.1 uncharacterized protein LOC126836440 [Adelges cooleyi]XP_050425807.1 uncharacterized protein LOC126836440 [Adelges cooleyi]
MQIFCLLLSFLFVNVSTDKLTEYINEVSITNAHINFAHNMNNFILENTRIPNGLEYVIERIVQGNRYNIEIMNNMITVPDYAFLRDIQKSIHRQRDMRIEIGYELKINIPSVDQNSGDLNLRQLGEARRLVAEIALKNIINRAHDFKHNIANLVEQRRLWGTPRTFQKTIATAIDEKQKDSSLGRMCNYIGLWTSTRTPSPYIIDIRIRLSPDCVCTLWDQSYEAKVYRPFGGVYWQVDADVTDRQIMKLQAQLLL